MLPHSPSSPSTTSSSRGMSSRTQWPHTADQTSPIHSSCIYSCRGQPPCLPSASQLWSDSSYPNEEHSCASPGLSTSLQHTVRVQGRHYPGHNTPQLGQGGEAWQSRQSPLHCCPSGSRSARASSGHTQGSPILSSRTLLLNTPDSGTTLTVAFMLPNPHPEVSWKFSAGGTHVVPAAPTGYNCTSPRPPTWPGHACQQMTTPYILGC